MLPEESHLTDQDLLQALDGELPAHRAAQVATHLYQCWSCRARKQEMEQTIRDFLQFHRDHLDPLLPSPVGSRALLKARMAEWGAAAQREESRWLSPSAWRPAAAALLFVTIVAAGYHYASPLFFSRRVTLPEPTLTPGVAFTASREQVCNSLPSKNRAVPPSLQRQVFQEYGIPGAEPRAYEVDYLITPALGGADDIRNLWPQSYSATTWNARVKDTLEDHLRELVCSGQLDLPTAQRDISSNWIAAYRKYFHTDKPLDTAR
jgi:hypothetical protein